MGLTYQVQYKKGRENRATNALSRSWEESELSSITTVAPTWIEEAKQSYNSDTKTQQLIQELQGTNPLPNFKLTNGLIRYNGRLFIGSGN